MKRWLGIWLVSVCLVGFFVRDPTLAAVDPSAAPRIVITPLRALIDEPVNVVLQGFPAGRSVTVRVRATDDAQRTWESQADFRTDPEGAVDLSSAVPLSGTYKTADGAGLFWSMEPVSGDKKAMGFVRDGLQLVPYGFTAEIDGKAVASAVLERLFVAPGVQKIPVRDEGLRGTFFVPPGKDPRTAILVLGGSGGGLQEGKAALLASKGFAALALAYFAHEDLPKSLESIPLEYFEKAIRWLQARGEVLRDRIAVMGTSRGGELSLLLGATFPEIGAVVANVPSGVMWGGVSAQEGAPEQPSWSYRGRPLPYLSESDLTSEQKKKMAEIPMETPIAYTPWFLIMLENPAAVEKAFIPVERIRGPVLLISGKDDRMWPSTALSEMVMERLQKTRHPYPDRHLAYEKAGHFIPIPNLPATVTSVFHPIAKMDMALGGTAPEVAAAAAESWTRTLEFLDAAFKK